MKKPNRYRCKIVFAAASMWVTLACASERDQDKAELQESVAKLEYLLSDSYATAVSSSEHVVFGRLFHRESEDAVAIFSIEGFDGGNTFRQFVAIFARLAPAMEVKNRKRFQLVGLEQVGGSGWRAISTDGIRLSPQRLEFQAIPCSRVTFQCDASRASNVIFEITFKIGCPTKIVESK